VRGRPPWKLAFAAILLYVFVAFPLVTASRLAITSAQYVTDRSHLASLMFDYVMSNDWQQLSSDYQAVGSLSRGLLPYFANIIEHTGHSVPYMNGQTLLEGLEQVPPRFLHSDKPEMNIGNWTAQAYGVIHWTDDVTNISPSSMGEFYMNYGISGVFLGMFLVGVLAVLVDRFVIVQRDVWTMPIMLSFLKWQESFVGHTVLPFIKTVVAAWLVVVVVRLISTVHVLRRGDSPA
jgi:hypothetical protein